MTAQEYNFIKRLQKQEPSLYSQDFIETDIERLTRFYQSEGFLSVEIRLDSTDSNEHKKRVDIYFTIKENKPIMVNNISIKIDNPPVKPKADVLLRRLKARVNLKEGSRFTDQMLYSDVSKINNRFINLGYAYARTDYKLNLTLPDSTDIAYEVFTGRVYQFGETSVSGNKYIKESIIRKQFAYKPGETFRRDKLDKTRQNLYNLQLFRIVSISQQTDNTKLNNPLPIDLLIEEMPRWQTRFGVGYGTEDKFRAFADITYRGLFHKTSRLNLYAKHSALEPYSLSLAWIQPQFFLKNLSISFNPYLKRIKEPGYDTQTLGLKLPVNYTFNTTMSTTLSYYFESVTQHIESGTTVTVQPDSENSKFLYNKSGLTTTFTLNNSKPIYDPTQGEVISIGGKINGYIFGGDFSYTRLWVDMRKYIKIKDFTFALRGMIGGVHSSDSSGFIPVEDRFYSGGGNSNRGWSRSMLGPKRETGTPSGGKSIVEMNFEIRRHLFWRIEIAAFMDASNIWAGEYDYRFDDLAYAAGGGIRINTPIGPVRLDAGVPLWNEKKSLQLFFSIGQAF